MKRNSVINIGLMLFLGLALTVPSIRPMRAFLTVLPPVQLTPGDEVTVNCLPGSTESGSPQSRRIVCPTLTATPVPTATRTVTQPPTHGAPSATPSKTLTPVSATGTPTQSTPATASKTSTPLAITLTPSKSPTPGTGNVSPFLAAPLCVDSDGNMHSDVTDNPLYGLYSDVDLWHNLWNKKSGCHYGHTHNADPALADSVFGPVGALWGGQSISYPFPTANENNMMGHPGYKYEVDVRANAPVPQESFEYLNPDPNYVTAFRIEYHDAGGNAHMVKRFHSYYIEARIRSLNGAVTGFISTGGYADYGCLHGSYKDFFILLPGIDPVNGSGQSVCGNGQTIDQTPYRSTRTLAEIADRNATNDNVFTWSADSQYGYNGLVAFSFRTLDSWGGMAANDIYTERFICPSFNCKFNNSVHDVYTLWFRIPSSLDAQDGNQDGKVTYTGYTDVKGNIVQGCTVPGLNCVPLKMVNVPVGNAIISEDDTPRTPGVQIPDYDVYFNSNGSYAGTLINVINPSNYIQSGWIKFPN